MSVGEPAARAVETVVNSLKGNPLAIGLLVINIMFLGVVSYVLGQVSANAAERNKSQIELITTLIKDIRDCHRGPSPGQYLFRPAG